MFQLTLRQKEIVTGLAVLCVAFGWVIAAEIILQVQQAISFGGMRSVEKSDKYYIDETTGLRLPVPNSQQGQITINSLGFRGPEIEMPKPPDRIRVAFLGSSTTFDPYIPTFDRTWSAQTVDVLRRQMPSCQFDLVNAGVPGLGTASLVTYYRHFINQTEPDIVVIWTSDMNNALDQLAEKTMGFDGQHYTPSLLAEHSLFWAKIEKNAVILSLQRGAHNSAGKLDISDADLTAEFKPALRQLIAAVRNDGGMPVLISEAGWLHGDQSSDVQEKAAETMLFYMPYMSIQGLLEAKSKFNLARNEVADQLNVPVIAWSDHVRRAAENFVDSSHLSPVGARAFGSAIGRELGNLMSDAATNRAAHPFACVRQDRTNAVASTE